MSKQTALEIAQKDGVKPNAIYMRRLRERRKLEAARQAFSLAWPELQKTILERGRSAALKTVPPPILHWIGWFIWCSARGMK